ncbi:MAG: hypothetical protein MR510_16020 [Clostridium sp.]|uniref:hypothetical protein n=1 Tax=Clostridium sp. TaxID=1506 RepID=UPI00280B0513|nr:hypothetical protein [Clostridium sp.]MCI6693949.1 hypothetical protein [Clostridium sp.]MDY2630037.1 hypothetical protein [Clostridium sp.]
MKIKKISTLLVGIILTVGLAGCKKASSNIPEGDVKVVNQEIQGVVELILKSANYGSDKSTVVSMVLPKDSEYNINLSMEKYLNGQLQETKEIANYGTDNIKKDSIIHIVLNTAKANDGEADKSIYSIAEIDSENTKDNKNPNYKVSRYYGEPINFDSKTSVAKIGKDLEEEVTLVGLVKYKENDTEKPTINLETYKDEVNKYSEVTIINAKVNKK